MINEYGAVGGNRTGRGNRNIIIIIIIIVITIIIIMALQTFVGPWSLFSFLIIYTVGKTS
jgi:t-SNARE complex subunit (syntaxin)